MFIVDGVRYPKSKYILLIIIISFVLIWSLWMNSVMLNISDIQSIQINDLKDEICRLNKIIETYVGNNRACYIP